MKSKRCGGCGRKRRTKFFYRCVRARSGLQSFCIECLRTSNRTSYLRNKGTASYRSRTNERKKARRKALQELVQSIKKKPCTDCGGIFPHYVLDFDHVRGVKRFGIAAVTTLSVSTKVLMREIAKCELVCANCHRIRTHTRKDHA